MSREILIQFADSAALEGALIGKKVVWKNETTTLTGQIVGFHGKKGMLRARFKKGVPGQAIGTTVELVN
jgi:large subunit ribosomal protein L35Ae